MFTIRRTALAVLFALAMLLVAGAAKATVTPIGGSTDPYAENCLPQGFNGLELQGDNANDDIFGSPKRDLLIGGGGDDNINGSGAADCLLGDNGADKIVGAAGGDAIAAGQGNDEVHGTNGDDLIEADYGEDQVNGGDDNDAIDTVDNAADDVDCGAGHDIAFLDDNDKEKRCELTSVTHDGDKGASGGACDAATFNGRVVAGTDANDLFSGTDERDRLRGAGGKDTLIGLGGKDCLIGNKGSDAISGKGGNDEIDGGKGEDVLQGEGGDDLLEARDGERDQVRCDAGFDTVIADKHDHIANGCEVVMVGDELSGG